MTHPVNVVNVVNIESTFPGYKKFLCSGEGEKFIFRLPPGNVHNVHMFTERYAPCFGGDPTHEKAELRWSRVKTLNCVNVMNYCEHIIRLAVPHLEKVPGSRSLLCEHL
jgi:hypothetical protein